MPSRIAVFDTETSGTTAHDCIVSICWIIYAIIDREIVELKRQYFIVKPTAKITALSTNIHHITDSIARNGTDTDEVMKAFVQDISTVDVLVSHNINFDLKMVQRSLDWCELKMPSVQCFCTMLNGKYVVNAKNKNNRIKAPKLSELYYHFFGEDFSGHHNAIEDTVACAKCYFKLLEL